MLRRLPSCCAVAEPWQGPARTPHSGGRSRAGTEACVCWAGMLEHGKRDRLPNPAGCSWGRGLRGDVFWGDSREICFFVLTPWTA